MKNAFLKNKKKKINFDRFFLHKNNAPYENSTGEIFCHKFNREFKNHLYLKYLSSVPIFLFEKNIIHIRANDNIKFLISYQKFRKNMLKNLTEFHLHISTGSRTINKYSI